MSGYYPPGQQPPYQQQGYPPQQYGAPSYPQQQPPAGYPPQGHSPYPPQGHSPYPPQGHSPYAPPPGQAPYQQQPGFGGPPPMHNQHAGYPPQQPYGAPQPGYGPPAGQYGAPAPMAGPPTPASPGYLPGVLPPTDMNHVAAQLRDSMKGFGTNEKLLTQVLTQVPDPPHMDKLRRTYDDRFKRSLLKDIEKETSGWYEAALLAIARGPLLQDAYLVEKAVKGLGTKESLLDDVCLGRSNADLNAIKQCYQHTYGKDMVKEIKDDLSMKTAKLYEFVLSARRAEESAPCLPHEIDAQVDRLQQATVGTKIGANQEVVCQILAFASDGQIRAINHRYQEKYRTSLESVLKKEFSGHMEDALLLMLGRAVDRVKSDAEGLEDSMKGVGTKDELLINRLVRCHWNREHLRQVNVAYKRFYSNKNLIDRVRSETSGDYRNLVMALCL